MSQMVPEYGGCAWPVDETCLGDEWDELSEQIKERAIALASSTLRRLTAFRVGGCPVTVRPCSPRGFCAPFVPFSGTSSWIDPGIGAAGLWVNACGCSGGCACEITQAIELPRPIGRVDEVRIDGDVVDPADYAIREGRWLVWTGTGESPFPAMQNMNLPDTLPGTFSVTYLNAYPVDLLGAQAVGKLAAEFAKACKPKGNCSLPRNVTNVVRNGVSFTIQAGLFPQGRTGIDLVDAYIELWNPDHRSQATLVWTP